MIGETFTCALPSCDVVGVKATHNQKYCSPEHCGIATNARLTERYHERVAIKKGKKRICRECDITVLSRYNPSTICGGCEAARKEKEKGSVANLLSAIST